MQLDFSKKIATNAALDFYTDVDNLYKQMQKKDFKWDASDRLHSKFLIYFGAGQPLTVQQVQKIKEVATSLKESTSDWSKVYIRHVRSVSERHMKIWRVQPEGKVAGQAFPRVWRTKDSKYKAAPDFVLHENVFDETPKRLAGTLVHELTHAINNTKDFGYMEANAGAEVKSALFEGGIVKVPSYKKLDYSTMKLVPIDKSNEGGVGPTRPELGSSFLINNADTYAEFFYDFYFK